MKHLIILSSLFILSAFSMPTNENGFYSLRANGLMSGEIDMNDYKGKYVLIVNVASKCGYTGQYADLEELSERYADKLVVIGFPCNQFGKQEPGSAEEIAEFCSSTYGVKFPMAQKVDVKGDEQHPVYQWLTSQTLDGDEVNAPKWNFHKYLISPEGELIGSFKSSVKPMDDKIVSNF